MQKKIHELESKLEVKFNNIKFLETALTHRSYLNENKKSGMEQNERLEFLGDAVLELVVTDFLFKKFPEKNEGEMTSFRSALVNAVTLSDIALNLGINDYLLLSRGETKDTGRARQFILANTIEAVIGAIYLDQGYNSTAAFIHKFITVKIDGIIANQLWIDPKSLFQEKAQEITGITPSYKSIKEVGPDHDKQFTIGVYLGAELVGSGDGKSKQDAEQEAAKSALKNKGW